MQALAQQSPRPRQRDGKLLLVWHAGFSGGIRMRHAPFEGFAQAPDMVVFDDKASLSYVTIGLSLLGGGPAAILFVHSSDGARAFRIAANGSFSGSGALVSAAAEP